MRHVEQAYALLLRCYPRSYREAFGAQMLQTFKDHYSDVLHSEGRVPLGFWFALLADELRNISAQQWNAWAERGYPAGPVLMKAALSVCLALPTYVCSYALLVSAALALPHPPVRGIAAPLVLGALLLAPLFPSLLVGQLLAGRLLRRVRGRRGPALLE